MRSQDLLPFFRKETQERKPPTWRFFLYGHLETAVPRIDRSTSWLQVLFQASSQSAFHLSIALLLRYRSRVAIFRLRRNTPPIQCACTSTSTLEGLEVARPASPFNQMLCTGHSPFLGPRLRPRLTGVVRPLSRRTGNIPCTLLL